MSAPLLGGSLAAIVEVPGSARQLEGQFSGPRELRSWLAVYHRSAGMSG